jgi:putative NADPH-quinone reductase
MSKRIFVIQGHPDASAAHLCHALADSYTQGALSSGHSIRQCHVAALDFPILRSQQDFEAGSLPTGLQSAQDDILWCEHLALFFPLWAGGMPALLKGFMEQVFRPGFTGTSRNPFAKKPLSGRSARLVVTMAMPALFYRWYFRAHGVKSLERNILGMVGMGPVHDTFIGLTADMQAADAAKWLDKLMGLGKRGE